MRFNKRLIKGCETMANKKQWYEKYIGYCFNDNGKEVILEDIFSYEDSRKGYQLFEKETNKRYITDYQTFKTIAKQTNLPK